MGSGGYRPGGGRPKGVRDSKPRKGTAAQLEAEKIQQMLELGMKAKAKFYQEFLIRVSKGEKLTLAEKNMMDKLAIELASGLKGEKPVEEAEKLDPLTYMLRVMNDPNETDKARRDRLAIAAAPYIHPKAGETEGKKDAKMERAKEAGRGKFQAGRPPIALVK